MSAELFPSEAGRQDSPRLAWVKANGILTWHDNGKRDGVEVCPPQWFCGVRSWWPTETGMSFFGYETGENGDSRIGEGTTEDEALADLAKKHGLKLWNEVTS
jgi:hypothetical protein